MIKADFAYYLTQFLGKYLPGEKNSSHHTIESYAVTFKLLMHFCEQEMGLEPNRLSLADITHGFCLC